MTDRNGVPLFDVFVFYEGGLKCIRAFTWVGNDHDNAKAVAKRDARHFGYRDVARVELKPEGEYEVVNNLMTNLPVVQAKDTPHCCRVDNETYWAM